MSENLPIKWEDEMAKSAKEIATRERPTLSNISLRAGLMSIGGVAAPGNKLECIIMASVMQYRFYKDRFDPNNPANPICFAIGHDKAEMVPHEEVKERQAETCEVCEHSKWGSNKNSPSGSGKACREVRRLALIPAGAKDIGKAEIAILTIPVTSIGNWGNYVTSLVAQYSRPPWGVRTEISVSPHVKKQFEVKFETLGLIDDDALLGDIFKRISYAEEILFTPYEATEATAPQAGAEGAKPAKY